MPIIDKERVIGVQFGVFSPQEIIRRSVVRVTSSGTHEGNDPKIGGLFDPRMGVLDNNRVCPTDGKKSRDCPGYFGHQPLVRPVQYIQQLPLIIKVLKCVCPRCGKLLVDRNDPSLEHIMNMPRKSRASEIQGICSKVKRCGDLTLDGCGAAQPDKIEKVGMATISATWKSITNEDGTALKQDQTVEQVLSILQRISDEDCKALGQSEKWGRPDWMICEVLPVAPPTLRPSIKQENNQRSEDDITQQQIEIIKADETLRAKIQSGARQNVIDDQHQVLQYHVATLADNDIAGVAPSAHRLGRPLRCIAQRLGGKEGRIRANLMGKRVNFSARSVITGDPNISVEELGVPVKIAMNLTYPERVNRNNIERLQSLVNAGPDQQPGAKTVQRASEDASQSLRVTRTRAMKLQLGDVVHRHLIDGDTVLFNRQPSLHRPSMMAHRVVVLPQNSFRLNVTVTPPQNADFDGDEMNAHIPQSELAVNELRQLAAVRNHLVSARMNSPIIVPVQDTLLGVNRLTKERFSFNRRDAMNMLMHAYNQRETVPTPRLAGERFTGQQLVESILPPISVHAKGLDINAGEYVRGEIAKGVSKNIVHQIINDFGNENAVKQLDALQRIVAHFLVLTGFSVGVSDLVADSKTRGEVDEAIRQKKAEVMRVMSEVHLGLMENKTGAPNELVFEENVLGILNKANELAGNRAVASLSEQNRMTNMVKAGSKGNNLNIAQMTACLGQINVDGKRIQYGQDGRTLPHFRKYDDGPEARGFVESSFIEGLTPTEFFFHAISGREGLIDTAVKSVTQETPVYVSVGGVMRYVRIGEWIDGLIDAAPRASVEVYDETQANMELLRLEDAAAVYIPTMDATGKMSWGRLTAVTRHDPGRQLQKITTKGGRNVTVTASKSLLVWSASAGEFTETDVASLRTGDYLPTSAQTPAPATIKTHFSLESLFPKTEYVYGDDFHIAVEMMREAMNGREQIPAGWWKENNGRSFTLPYTRKAALQRVLVRSGTENIKRGCVYPYHATRQSGRIPASFALDRVNGTMTGLFIAEGHASVSSGNVCITNCEPSVIEFAETWFANAGIKYATTTRENKIGGTSTTVVGYSRMLAQFFTAFVGAGAASKHLPDECLSYPDAFIEGLCSGQFSGDGHITRNSIESSTASRRLADDFAVVLTRLGIFAKVFTTQLKNNNLGTEVIAPAHRLSIRGQWARIFQERIVLADATKQQRLETMKASETHRGFKDVSHVVLDAITDIAEVDPRDHPKMYDVTVPDTLNFGLANGLQVRDTSDTGYTQRQLIKSMEDLKVHQDGSVRNANGMIVQTSYGEDGLDPMKVESMRFPTAGKSVSDILRDQSFTREEKMELYLEPKALRRARTDAEIYDKIREQTEQIVADRDQFVEVMREYTDETEIQVGVPVERIIDRAVDIFKTQETLSDATPRDCVECFERCVRSCTQPGKSRPSRAMEMLLRATLHPAVILRKRRLSQKALEWISREIEKKFLESFANAGEMVGVVSAQSMGEPATQLTLNSFAYDTDLLLYRNGKIEKIRIGDFTEQYMNEPSTAKEEHPNDTRLVQTPAKDDIRVLSTDEDGNVSWLRVEAATKHPVVNADGSNTVIRVKTQGGREVIATKSKSFLTCVDGKLVPTAGEDIGVGDLLPVHFTSFESPAGELKSLDVSAYLPKTDYIQGSEFNRAREFYGRPQWWKRHHKRDFTLPQNRSDSYVRMMKQVDGTSQPVHPGTAYKQTIASGYVYPAKMRQCSSLIPEEIPLDWQFGYYLGAYCAEGCLTSTQISISNNSDDYLKPIENLCDKWNITWKRYVHTDKNEIGWTSGDIRIYSTVFTELTERLAGKMSHNKTLPAELLTAPREFLCGFLSAYFGGDGSVYCEKSHNQITAASTSRELLEWIQLALQRVDGIYSRITTNTPITKNNRGTTNFQQTYTMHISCENCVRFANHIHLTIPEKQTRLETLAEHSFQSPLSRNDVVLMEGGKRVRQLSVKDRHFKDIILEKITSIEEMPNPTPQVYDLTIEKTKNFNLWNSLAVRDTFHMSGTSKANATRGVPRLKEIIHLSKNLKAPSLTIQLDAEHKRDQEKAERVRNRTHRTLIRDLVSKTYIYFEPSPTHIHPEDRQLIETQRLFEEELMVGARSSSPWVLRFKLNPREMLERGISIEDIEFVLAKVLAGSAETVMGETLAQELVMRIRLHDADFDTEKDAIDSLRELEKRILNTGVMGGVPGIDYAVMRKETNQHVEKTDQGDYVAVEEWVIDTNGTNFLGALQIDGIDPTKLISNDIVEIQNVLGIDAARNALIYELTTLLNGEGAQVNPHHISLLCDNMTYRGRILSVDRHGVSKSDIGPLGKASFEETEITLLRAASHGELDPVTGVSANIMFGQTIAGGTSMSRVALDEDEMNILTRQGHIIREREEAAKREREAIAPEEKQGADVIAGCAPERIAIGDVGGDGAEDRFARGANELDDDDVDFEEED